MKDNKKIIVFYQGSFDLLHFGHIRALQRTKSYGDYLIIGLNTDNLYRKYKEKEPVIPYIYRKKILEAIKYIDEIIPANEPNPIKILKKIKPDIYVICQEWKDTKKEEIKYMESIGKKIVIIPYLKTISSSEIRTKIIDNYLEHSKNLCQKCHKKM